MKEATSLSPSSPTCSSLKYQSHDVEEYQVDTSSTTSSKDYQDEDEFDTDGAIVLSEKPNLPSFGSVSVVNSNDVHFGNKTVYQGPVTIKQFVYPGSATAGECVSGLEECVKKIQVDIDLPPAEDGVDNPTFVNDNFLAKDGADKVTLPDSDAQRTLSGITKGFLSLKNLPNQHARDIVIFMSVIIVSITIVTTVVIYSRKSEPMKDISTGDTEEEDEIMPVDFSPDTNITINRKLRIFTRKQWLAQPPTEQPLPLKTPVSLVIIQHTATESCSIVSECNLHMKTIQKFHIYSNGWWDIAYNFLVGGDGAVYEGRGWTQIGSHTFGYNNISIGVGFIGTFTDHVPPISQIIAFKQLVQKGIELGYVTTDYKIVAASQLSGTKSPGPAFFKLIKTWSHWSSEPYTKSTADLPTK